MHRNFLSAYLWRQSYSFNRVLWWWKPRKSRRMYFYLLNWNWLGLPQRNLHPNLRRLITCRSWRMWHPWLFLQLHMSLCPCKYPDKTRINHNSFVVIYHFGYLFSRPARPASNSRSIDVHPSPLARDPSNLNSHRRHLRWQNLIHSYVILQSI